jgi:putative MATE family efflux protein
LPTLSAPQKIVLTQRYTYFSPWLEGRQIPFCRSCMQTLDFGRASTGRLLWQTALPSIASLLLVAMYHTIDRIFVGQAVGTVGLAAVTVALPLMLLGFAGTMMAHAGGSSLMGRLLGSGDTQGATLALGQTLLLGLLMAVLSAGLCWYFLEPLLVFFGASQASLSDARSFSLLMIAAFPILAATVALDCGLWAQGRPQAALLVMASGVVVNTLLCALFVLHWDFGVVGSGWATVLGEIFALCLAFAIYHWGNLPLQLRWHHLRWHTEQLREMVQMGFGSGLAELLPVLLLVLLTQQMAAFAGDTGVALVGVFETIWMLGMMPVFGICQAAAVLMSFNHGAGFSERVRRILWQSWLGASGVLMLAWLLLQASPLTVMQLFAGDSPDLLALGVNAMPIYFMALPLAALPHVLAAYFRSCGQGLLSALVGLSQPVIFLLPALIVFPHYWDLQGLLWATPVADCLALILSAGFLCQAIRQRGHLTWARGD